MRSIGRVCDGDMMGVLTRGRGGGYVKIYKTE